MTEKDLKISFGKSQHGLIIWWPPHAKFGPQDIFSIFDCITLNEAGETHFHQITTIDHRSHRWRKIEKYIRKNLVDVPANWWLSVYDPRHDNWKNINLNVLYFDKI